MKTPPNFQAEQEVHRDLCNLALFGLYVHPSLPSPHRTEWSDLCRGERWFSCMCGQHPKHLKHQNTGLDLQ